MNKKKISIIIPVYNVEEYIRQCLDSVVNQTYREIEIILVDDWSTDNSWKICDEYAKKDKRIKVIHQENADLSAARNAWLKVASWEYIWYIDSDDYVELDMYEKLYNLIEDTWADLAVCNRYFWDDDGRRVKNTRFPDKKIISQYEALEYFYKYMFVWNKLYRKEMVKNLYFVETRAQDVIYNFQIFKKIKKIACLNECKNYYRSNPKSRIHTKKFRKDRLILIREWLNEEIKYAQKNGLFELKKWLIKSKLRFAAFWLSLLALENSPDKESVKYLQSILKKNIITYLISKRSFLRKCFGIIVCINFNLSIILYKLIMKMRWDNKFADK